MSFNFAKLQPNKYFTFSLIVTLLDFCFSYFSTTYGEDLAAVAFNEQSETAYNNANPIS